MTTAAGSATPEGTSLISLLGTRKGPLTGAAILSVLSVALGLVPFFCIARMADAIFRKPPNLDEVLRLSLVALGAVALRSVLVSASSALAHVAAFGLMSDLRLRIAQKLASVPISFFGVHKTGELKRTMMDDVGQIEGFVAHHFPDGVAAFTVPVAAAIALWAVDWRMALASIVLIPVAGAAMALTVSGGQELHQKWLSMQDRTNHSLLEFLRGIHVIKTFGLSARSFGDLARSIEENTRWIADYMRANGKGYAVFQSLVMSSAVVLVPLGGMLHLRGSLSLPDLALFLVLGPQLGASMVRLIFAWESVQRIGEGNKRIAKLLGAPDLETRGDGSLPLPQNTSLALRDVSFAYGETEVLSNVELEFPQGAVTALVGPSGAGKTTVAHLLARLWEPTGGRVELGGIDVRELPLDTLLERIAVVFQNVFLFHGSVRENLRIAKAGATDEELVAACTVAQAHGFIEALPDGYDTLIGERGARLSGGEKQRLSIARAVLKNAPILILDEATAFADAENEALIQDALARLCHGRTVIVIAHRLSTIAAADHIVLLSRGRVSAQGTHDALLATSPLYAKLWRDQTRASGWSLGEP